jgi:hypothetical protein
MKTVYDVIPAEDVYRVHGNANFGTMKRRDVIAEGVLSVAFGYHVGSTMLSILLEHKLARRPKNPYGRSPGLTLKGTEYLRAAWDFETMMKVGRRDNA